MSTVRYTNKKTGWVSVYESKSNYDPVTKKSRPIRKYIGHEDPITGEFIPSSGKAGRKKNVVDATPAIEPIPKTEGALADTNSQPSQTGKGSYYVEYKRALKEISRLREENNGLKADALLLCGMMEKIAPGILESLHTAERITRHWR